MCDAVKNTFGILCQNMLYKYGFSFAFLHRGVGDRQQFISLFKQSLKDNHLQKWNSSFSINEIPKLQCYSKFKNVFEVEKYLSAMDIRKYRVVLTKFHYSNHSLYVELGRQKSPPYHLRFCVFCKFSGLNCID